MISLLENLEIAWEMTVLPHPKAPGIAVVPPCTHLGNNQWFLMDENKMESREKCVKNALSSQERVIGSQLLCYRTRSSDGPKLQHCVFGGSAFEFCFQNYILKWAEQLPGIILSRRTSTV